MKLGPFGSTGAVLSSECDIIKFGAVVREDLSLKAALVM